MKIYHLDFIAKAKDTYRVDPVDEGRHSGEDGGLSHLVATAGGSVAGNTVDPPGAVHKTVQGTSRVALEDQQQQHNRADGPVCRRHRCFAFIFVP